jgi:hypothetical protein
MFEKAKWIWTDDTAALPNQYACFRKTITLDRKPSQAVCYISVDSDYVLYVNGSALSQGQFSDFAERKTYTEVNITRALRTGENVVAVLAYYRGRDFSTYQAGQPGLLVALHIDGQSVVSDHSWRARRSPAYRSGDMPVVTVQLAYTIEYDARQDDAWITRAYDDTGWPPARVIAGPVDGYWREVLPRPLPPCTVHPERAVTLVCQGDFLRAGEDGAVAEIMARDALVTRRQREVFAFQQEASPLYQYMIPQPGDALTTADSRAAELLPPDEGATGRFLLLDLGEEETGFLTFDIDAPAGTILEIAHGEHLDDGRVRMVIEGRNFADCFICADGRNRYTMPFRRLGARYLQVHISNFSQPVTIRYIGLKPVHYPASAVAPFLSNDSLANRVYAVGERTLRLCMHEHYEDCPWREQALYAGDGRNQALYGYYAFGNYDFAATSYDLLGRSLRDDYLLELCAPARVPVNIPTYSLQWITALAEHYLFSGDAILVNHYLVQMQAMLDSYSARFDRGTELYLPPEGEGMWYLYDWMDGLAGECPDITYGTRRDAAYNLLFHETLGKYAWLLEMMEEPGRAAVVRQQRTALGKAIMATFWDEDEGILASYWDNGRPYHYAEYIQILALNEHLVPADKILDQVDTLLGRQLWPITLYTLLYQALAFEQMGPQLRAVMARDIARYWEPMVLAGATSFWETVRGASDFGAGAGSLCHGWSALPVYYYKAWVLGIRPLDPGFSRFRVSPYPDRFFEAAGEVPTPAGPIHVQWRRGDQGLLLELRGPASLTPCIMPYPEAPIVSAWYNKQALDLASPHDIHASALYVE